MDDLMELTGQESGIVIYNAEETIICNWSSISGYPRIDPFGIALLGLGEDIPEVTGENITGKEIKDILEGTTLLWDVNDDMQAIADDPDLSGILYTLPGDIQVIAPDGWA